MVPFSCAFDSTMSFHVVPSFPIVAFQASKTWLLSPLPMTVNGYPMNTLYDCQSPILTVSPSFSRQIVLRWRKAGVPVAVVMPMGGFSCLVNLLPGPVDTVYDLTLGRDWFNNYCTTSVSDAQILMCLVFSSSPFSAVHPHHTCEFLLL